LCIEVFPGSLNQFDGLPEKKPQLFLSRWILGEQYLQLQIGMTARAHRMITLEMLQCTQSILFSLLGGKGPLREKDKPLPEFRLQSSQFSGLHFLPFRVECLDDIIEIGRFSEFPISVTDRFRSFGITVVNASNSG
jgi:hypothetical protein